MRQSAKLSTAFHEAGHAVIAWSLGLKVHSATIVPAPGIHGGVEHANPLRGIHLDYDGSDRARRRAEIAIIVCLAGPVAQQRYKPRSWRSYHGQYDHSQAADLALSLNGSDEATNAHLKYLAIVARDMVAALWPLIERVAGALIERRTLTAAEIATVLATELAAGCRPRD
jgi:hypothetical protein